MAGPSITYGTLPTTQGEQPYIRFPTKEGHEAVVLVGEIASIGPAQDGKAVLVHKASGVTYATVNTIDEVMVAWRRSVESLPGRVNG